MRFWLALCLFALPAFASDKNSPPPHSDLLMPAFRMSPLLTQLELLKPGKDKANDKVRIHVVEVLADAGAMDAKPAIEAILKETKDTASPELVAAATKALDRLNHWTLMDRAGKVLYTWKPRKVDDTTLQILEDARQVTVRSITAEHLGKSGDPRVVRRLSEGLDNETIPGVRFKIFQALAALEHADATAVLRKHYESKTTSAEDKRYLEFFLAVKNHKEGNSVGFTALMKAPPSKKNDEAESGPKPKVAVDEPKPAPVATPAVKSPVQKLPLESDKKDACVYLYNGKCYDSLERLEKVLIAEIAKQGEAPPPPKAIDILSENDGKEVCEKGVFYDGKCFRNRESLVHYLARRSAGPTKTPVPTPLPKLEEGPAPRVEDTSDEYEKFSAKKVKIGELHSRQGGYLTFGYYNRSGLRGPQSVLPIQTSPVDARKDEKATRICFDKAELKKLLPRITEASLPVTETTEVVKGSLKEDDKSYCYLLAETFSGKGVWGEDTADLKKIREASESLFKGLRGIETLPKETQEKLKALWTSKKDLYDQVEAVAGFWRTEVKYLLEDHALYAKYFEQNKDHNLLQAAVSLKKGRCVPKNFGLGVAIYQLSEGKVPVRFAQVLWLEDSEKAPIEITLDRGHLHTQYLMPVAGQNRSVWVTAEASTSLDNGEQDDKFVKESGDIRAVVAKELGARKIAKASLSLKIHAHTTESYTTEADGKRKRLTKMAIEKLAKPEFEKQAMVIEEKDGKLVFRMADGAPQAVPAMSLVDIAGGKPEHLAIFLGIEATNRISLARTWRSLGGRRYRDVRTFTILIPEGRNAVIQDDMIFDFATDALIEKFTRTVDGVLQVEVTP